MALQQLSSTELKTITENNIEKLSQSLCPYLPEFRIVSTCTYLSALSQDYKGVVENKGISLVAQTAQCSCSSLLTPVFYIVQPVEPS